MLTDTTTTPTGEVKEMEGDPMSGEAPPLPILLTSAPLCLARTRAGTSCRCPAMRGRVRCAKHGGKSPGGPKGERNGNYRHGGETNEAVELRQQVGRLLKSIRSNAYA